MSSDGFRVEIQGAEEVANALDKVAWATTPRGMAQVLKDAGMVLRRRSMKAFREQSAPDNVGDEGQSRGAAGDQWEPLAESTKHARRKGRSGRGSGPRILQDTGTGRKSIAIDQDVPSASVAVGTAIQYMAYHQTGTEPYTIRARNAPMLVFMGPDGNLRFAKEVHHPGLPARPFLGYDMSDIEGILRMCESHLRRAAG